MFERRLKIFLSVLVLLSAVLMVRAVVVQVVRHDYWSKRAAGLLETHDTTETTRGRILDRNGAVLAADQPCTDAAVDYRAIVQPPDPHWVNDISADRVRARLGMDVWKHTARAQRKDMIADECSRTRADIDQMWNRLAGLYRPTDDRVVGDPRSAIADLRASIIQKVEMQRRWLWFTNFQSNEVRAADAPRWQRWLAGAGGVEGPDIDRFVVEVGDQKRPHVILAAIPETTANFLGKHLDIFPGLMLQPSIRRQYPQGATACHVLGRMSRVDKQDVLRSREANVGLSRQYMPNDEIGREGVEALAEPLLRGSRGEIERHAGSDDIVGQTPFQPGQDVSITIDAGLQQDVQDAFRTVSVNYVRTGQPAQRLDLHNMHGAAVVIDIPTGEVRALVSSPGFNLDQLDEQYQALSTDRLNAPLRDRATSDQLEPGSTVKPMIGLAGITQGVIEPLKGIECTGDLYLPMRDDAGNPTGRTVRQIGGRCWVTSEYGQWLRENYPLLKPIHHIVPFADPHRGHDGNADGVLSFSDALERSCNIFFETTADRLGPVLVSHWYEQFGFGRKTGIGIAEQAGRRPDQFRDLMVKRRIDNCFTGIGQGNIWATPLQIANEAATVARGGIWMRPRLLSEADHKKLDSINPVPVNAPPDFVDLHLDRAGLEQAKIGMQAVVYERAGTGRQLLFLDSPDGVERPDPILENIRLAAKTGTAEAARLWQTLTDAEGHPLIDPATSKPKRIPLQPSTAAGGESPIAPWYWSSNDQGTSFTHAWFMGYAPVEKPVIAFAVLVEYSPTGGGSASGAIARRILERCVARGYLHPGPTATASAW